METKDSGNIPWWQPSVILFARMSGWIAGPIIIAVIIGKFLDNKFNTHPWMFLGSVGTAFVISIFGISRDAIKAMKIIEEAEAAEAARKEAEEKANEEKNKLTRKSSASDSSWRY